MNLVEFLKSVVTTENGWLCLGFAQILEDDEATKKTWKEEFYRWPEQLPDIISKVNQVKVDGKTNIYFSPHLFKEPNSLRDSALPTRTIVADLDDANVLTLSAKPSVLVQTSEDRHQGYWILDQELNVEEHMELSRRLTYSIPRCDRSGWWIGHKFRLPETYNYKYVSGKQEVKVVDATGKRYKLLEFEHIPAVDIDFNVSTEDDLSWIDEALQQEIGPRALLATVKASLPGRVVAQYGVVAKDRSAMLWALMLSAFRAGLDRQKVFILAYHSANNKFKDLRYGGIKELGKDVLRAEFASKSRLPDIKDKIRELRSQRGDKVEQNAYIAKMVREYLEQIGTFHHTTNGQLWYIREDIGKPVSLTMRSEQLVAMVEALFGINGSESLANYIFHHLITHTNEIAPTSTIATLTHYDADAQEFLMHTGRKDILKVTKDSIEVVTNGYNGIIFPWSITANMITPRYKDLEADWADQLFEGCLDNIIGVKPVQAKAILKVWFMTVLLRDGMVSRPILALFGQPGCLSADTILDIRRGDHSSRKFTIKHAAKSFHGRWDKKIPTRIKSVKNDIVLWRSIKDIFYSGKKETYTIKVAGQPSFRTTKDHRFLTKDGYKRLEELSVGDDVIVQGSNLSGEGKSATWREEVSAKYHPHARMKMVGKYGPYGCIYTYRAVIEADMNDLTYEQFCWIVNKNPVKAAQLKYLPKDVVIHHRDENPYNNELSNLEVKDKNSHDIHHGYSNVRNFGPYSGMWDTSEAKILSIDYFGLEDTYDIEMVDEEAPNFLVNGVAVHNSGKSTLVRRVYALLYGKERAVNSVTKEEHFDYAVANDPLVVLDNVDGWAKWLADKLALSASSSEIVKRKLFTDNDIILLKRQAMVAVTAHAPKFGREDVTDRLLLLNFERLQHFVSETHIIDRIFRMRNALWGGILRDIQALFNTPRPRSGWPQFRVEDFASFGYHIATACGIEQEFADGLEAIRKDQKSFILAEDQMLIDTLVKLIKAKKKAGKEMDFEPAGRLWLGLLALADDENQFIKRYQNAIALGKKLWTLHDAMKTMFDIEIRYGKGMSREWKINLLEEVEVA